MRIKSDRKDNVDSSLSFSKRALVKLIFFHIHQSILFHQFILIRLINLYFMLRCRAPEVLSIDFSDKHHHFNPLSSFPLLTSPLFFTMDERRAEEIREDRVNAA